MIPTATNAEATFLTTSALINLYILDLTPLSISQVYYFHDGANNYFQPIIFNAQAYTPFPVFMSDFGYNGDGTISRPKVKVSNIGGFVSNLLLQGQDLEGALVTRRRVWSKFLDAVNFPNGNSCADPSAAYPDEVWTINQKTAENNVYVEWEVGPSYDLNSQQLPNRLALSNYCPFRYMGLDGCPYTGAPIADQNSRTFLGSGAGSYGFNTLNNRGLYSSSAVYNSGDYFTFYNNILSLRNIPQVYVVLQNGVSGMNPIGNTTQYAQDACQKTFNACRLHFPSPAIIPGGFFLGIGRAPYILGQTQAE